ncbi:MAG: NAD(P)H-dependent oxidoreductase [Proteobacteria bacterium]|nr:flavin reductase [Desulfobacula sp.]MBU4130945.1 NAD(P)H-dependent oxidoreductase [Pseudomonadota bacterium]
MFVLGIQGSPRKNGNSEYLLTAFLEACKSFGATTRVIHPEKLDIGPCRELLVCEKKGFCPIRDEMEEKGYSLVKEADVVVLASPVFFYNVTAQAKVFIDRCQMFWGRKYKLKLIDPDGYHRQGFLLGVGASGGKRLFEGMELTAKYFFDAISADYSGSLTYRNVEDAGDIVVRPELSRQIQDAAGRLLEPLIHKKSVWIISGQDACRSQMAAAFVKNSVKGKLFVLTAGLDAAPKVDPDMVKIMAEKNLDLKYRSPRSLSDVLAQEKKPDRVIFIGSKEALPDLPFEGVACWDLSKPATNSLDNLKKLRDEIEVRVKKLTPSLASLF